MQKLDIVTSEQSIAPSSSKRWVGDVNLPERESDYASLFSATRPH